MYSASELSIGNQSQTRADHRATMIGAARQACVPAGEVFEKELDDANVPSQPATEQRESAETCRDDSCPADAADFTAVTLVIPGRNVAGVVRHCLESVVPLLQNGELSEIVFVDDASTDTTVLVVAEYPVTILHGTGAGAGSARNIGWRAARTPLVWFIDADCVAEPGALRHLRDHFSSAGVAATGGSYTNRRTDSLLASLIHEEIVARHQRMNVKVNFLATYNVLYRRSVLLDLGGFDEVFRLAQDAELAFRTVSRGYQLHFERSSRVGHYHVTRLRRYLRTQARQGYYRVMLYRRHPHRMGGDHYSGIVDHIQPPLAALFLITALIASRLPATWIVAVTVVTGAAFLGSAVPMTALLVNRTRELRFLAFAPLSWLRAIARAAGLVAGLIRWFTSMWVGSVKQHEST